MPYDANREDGWTAYKIGAIWLGGILMVAVVAVFIAVIVNSLNAHNLAKWDACLDSGQTANECQRAVYGLP